MTVMDNPIWYREQRAASRRARKQRLFMRTPGIVLVWVLPAVIVMGIGVLTAGPSWSGLRSVFTITAFISMYLQILYLCFKGLVAGAGSVAREREQQTLETLLSSPLPVDRLMSGKFWSAALPLLGEALLAFPFSLSLLLVEQPSFRHNVDMQIPYLVPLVLCLLSCGCVLITVALGLVISARATNVTRATSPAVLLGVLLFFGTWVADCFIAVWTSCHGSSWTPCFTLVNPYAALASLQVHAYDPHSSGAFTWTYGWLITTLLYLSLFPLIVAVATWRFERATRA